jgi:hypothetical protein
MFLHESFFGATSDQRTIVRDWKDVNVGENDERFGQLEPIMRTSLFSRVYRGFSQNDCSTTG